MLGGFRIGRIFGINIRIDWSWVLIFLLITWNMSVVFGGFNQNWGIIQRWAVAIAASILFFTSILLHELAHSLVANSRGMSVNNITLFLFGGVSNIQREPSSPANEFWMAIVGPLTSIGLGLLFLLGWGATISFPAEISNPQEIMSSLGPLSLLIFWLGSVNIILGVFNMIPGFPLDGGRILRSILWAINDDLQRATRWASWIGQVIAWMMIVAGTAMLFGVQIPFFGTGLVNGMWLIFIGWFLNSAAIQSYQRVVMQQALEDVPVSNLMSRNPQVITPDITINTLIQNHLMGSDERAFPVVENDQFIGLVTLDDIRSVSRSDWDSETVRDIMTPLNKLETIDPGADAALGFNKLVRRDVSQLPVVHNSELVGILKQRDIVRWLQFQSDSRLS